MPASRKKSVTVLAAIRQRLWDSFNSRQVDNETTDLPQFKRINTVEASFVEATFETVNDQKAGWKILLDDEETPHDWDNFKCDLFMRIMKFA
jgi:hypothetical protein